MNLVNIDFSKKERRTMIFAVTLGNLLEWYEIYLYIHWAPLISRLFFHSGSELVNTTNMFLLFAMGFLARPLGGVFFGRLGDRLGRKKALVLSILMMTIPTFVTGFLPTYERIGIGAPIILGIMRLFQSFPAGGELPGAFCYLYESVHTENRKYMCSWGAYGFQVGILISTIECFLLERWLPAESLLTWGWRVSFLLGGLIGLLGLFLRYKLHETPVYREMIKHEHVVKEPLLDVILKHRKPIFLGILFCALNSSAFYFLTVNFPVYLGGELKINELLIAVILLIYITLPLPYIGRVANKVDHRKVLIYSTYILIFLLYLLYLTIDRSMIVSLILTMLVYCFLFTVLSALIPFILPDQFPTRVRFTCVGISFNIADAVIGGFTPAISLFLAMKTGSQTAFCWYILFCSILSLIAYYWMPTRSSINSH